MSTFFVEIYLLWLCRVMWSVSHRCGVKQDFPAEICRHFSGQFKRNHPETYSMDTVGYVLAGRWGQELFSIAYPMFMIFLAGSGFVAISIAFNAVSTHATCTVVWVVIAAVGTFALASIQTLNKVGIVSWIGFVSVMAAIMIITIAVGIQDRPVTAPQVGPWDKVS